MTLVCTLLAVPDLQRSTCSIMLRAPRFYLDLLYLLMINHVNMIFFYKQRVTCEKNDVCATVTIDRQIRNNNNNMRLNVLFIARALHTSLVFPGNCTQIRASRPGTSI